MIESIPPVMFEVQPVVASPAMQSATSTLYDVSRFEHLYRTPDGALETSPVAKTHPDTLSNGFELALKSLEGLESNLSSMGVDALKAAAESNSMTPGMMLDMTVRAQEFMFQSQLTATIANKSSEGITQLFRQQS